MKNQIIFDFDGTLTIMSSRIECLDRKPKDYDEFYARVLEDEVFTQIRDILLGLRMLGKHCVIVTGRRESTRSDTMKQLEDAGIPFNSKDILMRPYGDHRPDTELKLEMTKDFIDDVEMIFEDRPRMVKAWRKAGKVCLDVGLVLYKKHGENDGLS